MGGRLVYTASIAQFQRLLSGFILTVYRGRYLDFIMGDLISISCRMCVFMCAHMHTIVVSSLITLC